MFCVTEIAVGDLDDRTGRQRRAEHDRVVRLIIGDRGQRRARTAGNRAGRVVGRAVVRRHVGRTDNRCLGQIDLGQRARACVERVGLQGRRRARRGVTGLRCDDREEVRDCAAVQDGRVGGTGLSVQQRLIEARERSPDVEAAERSFVERAGERDTDLCRLVGLFVGDAGAAEPYGARNVKPVRDDGMLSIRPNLASRLEIAPTEARLTSTAGSMSIFCEFVSWLPYS